MCVGKDAFYNGRVARAIAECVQANGGLLTEEDLANHRSRWSQPLRVNYRSSALNRDVDVWENSLNSQAIVTLEALKLVEVVWNEWKVEPFSVDYYHMVQVEATSILFPALLRSPQ